MTSKEKPKKIGVIGTDGKVYYFLLKCDKQGDLRKEQRFIDFAMQCNKIFE
jgi:serine/threonine-protein kinase ATR